MRKEKPYGKCLLDKQTKEINREQKREKETNDDCEPSVDEANTAVTKKPPFI